MFIHAALFAHEREHIADEAGRAREVVLLPDDLVLPGGREEVVIAPRPLRRRHKACIDAGREHETMRGHPVAVGVAVLRRQLLAVGGGELPHDPGVDQHLQARRKPEHVRHHPAGLVLVHELDDVHLAVGAGEAHPDSVLCLER